MLVNEVDHGLDRRSSSAWAKYADALRRISFAWRSSRFSRSSALIRSRSPSSDRAAGPGHARPAAPSYAASRPCSRSSRQSRGSPPIARRARLGARGPSAPRAHEPQRNTVGTRFVHGSILSRVGASGKPGAVHSANLRSIVWFAAHCCRASCPGTRLDVPILRNHLRAGRFRGRHQEDPRLTHRNLFLDRVLQSPSEGRDRGNRADSGRRLQCRSWRHGRSAGPR